MIPYPHDTTDPIQTMKPVIEPSAFLDGRRTAPRRGFVFGSLLAALCLHAYAWAILPAAMDFAVEESQVIEASDVNLVNDEISNDPDLPTNYNVDRIDELTVPGPVNPNESEAAAALTLTGVPRPRNGCWQLAHE